MKGIKCFVKIILLLICSMCFYSCIKKVPVHVIVVNNELYFVLEKEYKITGISVDESNTNASEVTAVTKWTAGAESGKYLKLRQIKYGQNIEGFTTWTGPEKLQKNVEYVVHINIQRGKFAGDRFVINKDKRVIMPHSNAFKSIKNHIVTIEKNSVKTIIPYSIITEKNNNKMFVSETPSGYGAKENAQ